MSGLRKANIRSISAVQRPTPLISVSSCMQVSGSKRTILRTSKRPSPNLCATSRTYLILLMLSPAERSCSSVACSNWSGVGNGSSSRFTWFMSGSFGKCGENKRQNLYTILRAAIHDICCPRMDVVSTRNKLSSLLLSRSLYAFRSI